MTHNNKRSPLLIMLISVLLLTASAAGAAEHIIGALKETEQGNIWIGQSGFKVYLRPPRLITVNGDG